MNKFTSKIIAACASITGATAVFGHDVRDVGGLQGLHWHSTDTLGFVAVAGMVAAAVWLSRK